MPPLDAGEHGRAAREYLDALGKRREIVANSTARQAQGFDAARWLGQWLDRPQPSLGGRRPAELIDTPTGIEVVSIKDVTPVPHNGCRPPKRRRG